MPLKNQKLYFVALIPPKQIYERTMKLKEEVAEKFDSRAALKSPPHITLHMPFGFKEEKEDKIYQVLKDYVEEQISFSIHQNGFGSFAPRTIFINVQQTSDLDQFRSDLVRKMRRELNLDNADYKDQPFHPHMTIAFRDLKKSRFQEAWNYYKDQEFLGDWECNQVALLKHNGQSWDVYRKYSVG